MPNLYDDIAQAASALRPQVLVTPLTYSAPLSEMLGCDVSLKCEHLQHTGSFKFRGASNKVRLMPDAMRRDGVITASTGNHGMALAKAGALAGVPVTVYASNASVTSKQAAIRALGAELVTLDLPALDVELAAREEANRSGRFYVSPYNDLEVVAGQGTVGIELNEQDPDIDLVFVSVGGGGLIGGIGTAMKSVRPNVEIVGCWPENSPCMQRSLEAGKIISTEEFDTLSDGSAGGVEPGAITFEICQKVIDRTVLVSEDEIKAAMRAVGDAERWMIEGSAGVAMAGLMKLRDLYKGRKAAVVICGRNIALERFVEAVG